MVLQQTTKWNNCWFSAFGVVMSVLNKVLNSLCMLCPESLIDDGDDDNDDDGGGDGGDDDDDDDDRDDDDDVDDSYFSARMRKIDDDGQGARII